MRTTTAGSSAVGSEAFALLALLAISLATLLILRHYLPLRTTPAYLLVPIFFALGLPASIVLLVPIDLASHASPDDVESRGISLPDHVLWVSWRIIYWLTFALSWFILPILAEYSDAGYREPKARLIYSLRENAKYIGLMFGSGIVAIVYMFFSSGMTAGNLKATIMALAYCWALILAIYLMGHGLVAIPRGLFRDSSISGRLRRLQTAAPKVHENMEEAIQTLEDIEAQVMELGHRKTGTARLFSDWIDELAESTSQPELRPGTLSRRVSAPRVALPNVITENYMAVLTRKLDRAGHKRVRYIDEWDRLVQSAADTQAILDSAASKQLEIGKSSPHASVLERFTLFTPYTRYVYYWHVVPCVRIFFGGFFALASVCIIWSEIIKTLKSDLSVISLTVVHFPNSDRGQIGFGGQLIAACWIVYMCVAALASLTEVKVWRGRALVRRNTAYESAFWYAMQVAKLSVPLTYNFMTFISPKIHEKTVFYQFLGSLISFTPLGSWFDVLFPMFILVPVCATLFNLYGKVKKLVGFGDFVDDDDDEENAIGYGTGNWREGRDLIERELTGHSSLGRLREGAVERSHPAVPSNPHNRAIPAQSIPSTRPVPREVGNTAARPGLDPQQRREADDELPEEGGIFGSFGHRFKNTFDTTQKPKWMQNVGENFKKPKWMGGSGDGSGPARSGSDLTRWFAGRNEDGRVRL